MNTPEIIAEKSDSLIEILTAQCADLETLLALAQDEARATEARDFEGVLKIVSKRAALGTRLETYRLQIAELREYLGANDKAAVNSEIAARVIEIANLTWEQDQKTKLLLTGVRDEAVNSLADLEKGRRGSNAYLREETRGLSFNRII